MLHIILKDASIEVLIASFKLNKEKDLKLIEIDFSQCLSQ